MRIRRFEGRMDVAQTGGCVISVDQGGKGCAAPLDVNFPLVGRLVWRPRVTDRARLKRGVGRRAVFEN